MIISIVTSEDFLQWYKRRRPLWPELLVFEHGAQALLASHRAEFGDDAASTTASSYVVLSGADFEGGIASRGVATPPNRSSTSAGSMGVVPIEPEVPRNVSYFPSATPGFPVEHRVRGINTATGAVDESAEAHALLSSFRPESLRVQSERERCVDEHEYQAAREKHLRKLEAALTAPTPSRGLL